MNQYLENFSGSEFKNLIKALDPCMDNHLYLLDFKNDAYFISQSAVERFNIPQEEIENASEEIQKFTYPDDREFLADEINMLITQEKMYHNIQYRWLDREGNPIWINCRGRVLCDENGATEYLIGCINEIGKKQKADNVSGLLGEFSFQKEIEEAGNERFGGYILRLDIDNFKEINEKKGISYGDMILRKTAECILKVIPKAAKLYRIVADEFLVVDFQEDIEAAKENYHQVCKRVNEYIAENGYDVFYTISAGILDLSKVENQSYENLMTLSEFALNQAKKGGKNKHYVYNEEDYQSFLYKRTLIKIMRQAVNEDFKGFEAYFQPIVDINQKRLCAAETLLRFSSEETGFVSPIQFIPLLEESGLIIPVGAWVLDQAMAACSMMQKKIPDFKVSVNLSYIQVLKSDVLSEILNGLKKYGLSSQNILIELTESGFLERDRNLIHFCEGLQEHRIPLALDDFGTGYSNFHYLYDLRPDTIKIDRSFTLKALKNDYEYNLIKHMVDMSHSIGLKMCIEGIEYKEEYDKISAIVPDYIQGYYFGKPSPFANFVEQYVENEIVVE